MFYIKRLTGKLDCTKLARFVASKNLSKPPTFGSKDGIFHEFALKVDTYHGFKLPPQWKDLIQISFEQTEGSLLPSPKRVQFIEKDK